MPNNSHIHIVVSTDFLESLKREARKRLLTLSEFCRLKLGASLQLDRIENKINKMEEKIGNK